MQKVDISTSAEFQRKFDGFYRVRRNKDWRDKCFEYFEEIRSDSNIAFERIINALYKRLPQSPIESSFSSKLLATLTPPKPIWDSRVLKRLKFDEYWIKTLIIDNAIAVYKKYVIGTRNIRKVMSLGIILTNSISIFRNTRVLQKKRK